MAKKPTETQELRAALDAVRRVLGHAGIFGGREVMTARDLESASSDCLSRRTPRRSLPRLMPSPL